MHRIIHPVLDEMRRRGEPFTGFLYAGLMMTAAGPQVLEFNVRLGDPEAQALLHRLDEDFGELLWSAARGILADRPLAWRPEPSVCVVMASRGYPATSSSGDPITGIEAAEATGATVFHAGTRLHGNTLQTASGRVLGVTARSETLPAAIESVYRGVDAISFPGMQYRKDIGRKGLRRW
jgi:phosphoribosylamine--glycine ligase